MAELTDFKFDAYYLINLKRKPAKKAWALNELAEIGIKPTVIEAVDAIEMGMSSSKIDQKGAVGCLMSHRFCLQDALLNGFERIFIFEDDIAKPDATALKSKKKPLKPYAEVAPYFIEAALPLNPDLIFWGYDLRGTAPVMVAPHVLKPTGGVYGSQAISYHNVATIQKAFDLTSKPEHWDVSADELSKQVNALMPVQTLFDQVRSQTDIYENYRSRHVGEWHDIKFKSFCKANKLPL